MIAEIGLVLLAFGWSILILMIVPLFARDIEGKSEEIRNLAIYLWRAGAILLLFGTIIFFAGGGMATK